MPQVNGRTFSYDQKGIAAAAKLAGQKRGPAAGGKGVLTPEMLARINALLANLPATAMPAATTMFRRLEPDLRSQIRMPGRR